MTIDSTSSIADIYAETGYPGPSDDDLEAWNYIECGDDLCGTAGEDGYWYNQAGVFGWAYFSDFSDYCATATDVCSDIYDTENYDGWAVGIYTYSSDPDVLLNYYDSFGVAIYDADIAVVVYYYYDEYTDVTTGYTYYSIYILPGVVELSASPDEDVPDYADVDYGYMISNSYFGYYGLGGWFAEEIDTDPVELNLFKLQVVDDEDNYEVTDELDLWVFSSADATNVNSVVVLQEATTLIAASTVALMAALA